MFAGTGNKHVKILPIGAVSHLALAGTDPDLILLDIHTSNYTGSTLTLPKTAPLGKRFEFAVVMPISTGIIPNTQVINILVPLPRSTGILNTWAWYAGARPVFIYGPYGWIPSMSHGLSTDIANNSRNLAIGSGANGSSNGIAIGTSANGNSTGIAIGHTSDGNSQGVAIGNGAYGAINGVAIGVAADGGEGVAIGYQANVLGKKQAVAIGKGSVAQRTGELVKSADGLATGLRSFSILDWFGDTTNATPTIIYLGSAGFTDRAVVMASSAFVFKLLAVAKDNVNGVVSAWELVGVIKRAASGAPVIVGTVTKTVIAQDAAAAAWDIALSITNSDSLGVTVTGAAATTIRWNIRGDISETRF